MFDNYLTINQLAKLLGVKFYQIRYLHQAGHVQEPDKVGNVRLYSRSDIEKIVRFLENRGDWDGNTHFGKDSEYFSTIGFRTSDDHIIYVKEKKNSNEEGYIS